MRVGGTTSGIENMETEFLFIVMKFGTQVQHMVGAKVQSVGLGCRLGLEGRSWGLGSGVVSLIRTESQKQVSGLGRPVLGLRVNS